MNSNKGLIMETYGEILAKEELILGANPNA